MSPKESKIKSLIHISTSTVVDYYKNQIHSYGKHTEEHQSALSTLYDKEMLADEIYSDLLAISTGDCPDNTENELLKDLSSVGKNKLMTWINQEIKENPINLY